MARQSTAEWRKLIVEAYIDLLFEKPPYKIKVADICAQSGVPRSTFYTIFASADDCLEGIEKTLLGLLSLRNQLIENAYDGEGLSFEATTLWFETCFQHERVLAALTGTYGDPYFARRLQNQLKTELFQFSNEDMVPQDDLLPYAIENIAGSYITLLTYSLHLPANIKRISAKELASIASLSRVGYHVMVAGAPVIPGANLTGEGSFFKSVSNTLRNLH